MYKFGNEQKKAEGQGIHINRGIKLLKSLHIITVL